MKTSSQGRRVGITFLMVCLAVASAEAATTTNAVPWSDSFEAYSSGWLLQGTNGWSSGKTGAGLVTNAAAQLAELTNTYHVVNAHAYPLTAATHTNVVAVTDFLDNDILSSSGKVVVVDFTVMPTWCDMNPLDNTNLQCAFYINTNQHVVIWHRNPTLATNEWLDLGAGTLVNTGVWTRFTMVQDYSNRMFQIRVNDGTPISNAGGFSVPGGGGSPNGPWFNMVQTNALMARATFGDGGINYVDDFVVANRSLSWSASGFMENVTNNGAIDNTTPLTVALRYDTFTGTDGAAFPANLYTVGNLPSNLTAVVTQVDSHNLSITLAGQALTNEAANSIPNLTVALLDSAFALGSAANVDGSSNSTLALTFRNKGLLTYSTNLFQEVPVVNDGSINNTLVLTITLGNDVFTGENLEDYATNSAKLSINGLPAGLTGQVSKVSNTQLEMTLLGKALANASSDNTNFTLVFHEGAFATNPVAASVSNATMSIAIQYVDSPVLTYGATNFTEKTANNGSVNGTVVTLQYDTFTGTDGNELPVSAVDAPNLPSGLYLHAIRTNSGTGVVLVFSNQAAAHLSADSRSNIIINFNSGAFVAGNAAVVAGASRSNLSITFSNQPSLTLPGGLVFTESTANNGAIGNSLTVTVAGDTFATDLTGRYYVANVPNGLGAQLVRDSATQVTLSLTNQASPHTSVQSTGVLQLTFSNEAFTTVAAANITGSSTNLSVTFNNAPTLTYSRATFTELSFGTMDNRTPLVITLTGDHFADNVASLYNAVHVPSGLNLAITRDSATQLSVSLTGIAAVNVSSDSINTLTNTFLQGAFVNADANQVVNYQTNFSVVFMDDTSFVNTVPYVEPFEGYPNGFLLAGTNAWTADFYADAAQVTNDAAMNSKLATYLAGTTPPIQTNHTQTLLVRDNIRTEIHSPTGQLVYVDFLSYPVPMTEVPSSDTNLQCAFYVSTNLKMVIWHRNTTGTPANEWLALTNSPVINTSCWNRFTVTQDYTNHLFQLRVNEGDAIADPAGWTWSQGGLTQTGSWFHMVQTNDLMSRMIISGFGTTYLDDFTVRTNLMPGFGGVCGSIYLIR